MLVGRKIRINKLETNFHYLMMIYFIGEKKQQGIEEGK